MKKTTSDSLNEGKNSIWEILISEPVFEKKDVENQYSKQIDGVYFNIPNMEKDKRLQVFLNQVNTGNRQLIQVTTIRDMSHWLELER